MFNFHIFIEFKKYFGGYNSDQGFGFQSLSTPYPPPKSKAY